MIESRPTASGWRVNGSRDDSQPRTRYTMNSLRLFARWTRPLPRTANCKRTVYPGSQFQRNLATHGHVIDPNLTTEARPVTKVEKIILDTIKVGLWSFCGCNVE